MNISKRLKQLAAVAAIGMAVTGCATQSNSGAVYGSGQVQREQIATTLRRAGADHLRLRTDSDWLSDMVRFVVTRRRGVAVRPPSRASMIGTR